MGVTLNDNEEYTCMMCKLTYNYYMIFNMYSICKNFWSQMAHLQWYHNYQFFICQYCIQQSWMFIKSKVSLLNKSVNKHEYYLRFCRRRLFNIVKTYFVWWDSRTDCWRYGRIYHMDKNDIIQIKISCEDFYNAQQFLYLNLSLFVSEYYFICVKTANIHYSDKDIKILVHDPNNPCWLSQSYLIDKCANIIDFQKHIPVILKERTICTVKFQSIRNSQKLWKHIWKIISDF